MLQHCCSQKNAAISDCMHWGKPGQALHPQKILQSFTSGKKRKPITIADDAVPEGLFHLVDDGIGVGVGHDECLGTGALLRVFIHERIMPGNLP